MTTLTATTAPRHTPVPPRALRAGLAAAGAVVAAALAHAVGHGRVDVAGLAWAFVALVGPAWWLARRERGAMALTATQLAGQYLAHVVLTAVDGPAGHVHVAGADLMLYAHVGAAVLAGAGLRLAERRAWAAVCRFLLVVLPLPAVDPTGDHVAPAPQPPAGRPRRLLLRHALARRGPPLTT